MIGTIMGPDVGVARSAQAGRARRHFSNNQALTMRVAGAVVLGPQISPTITRAIFAPPTDDGSIWLA